MQSSNFTTKLSLFLALALMAPFLGASALSVDTNTTSSVNTNARLTGSSTVAQDEDEINSTSNGNVQVQSGIDANNDTGIGEEDFSIRQNSKEVKESNGTRIKALNVMTKSDLKAYAEGELKSDKNLTHLRFNMENVEVGYKQPGKFISIIPVNLNVRAIVASNGKVLVHYPWYKFLVMSDRSDVKAAIESEVSAYLTSNKQVKFTPGMQAEIASRIKAILEANLLNTSGTASTRGSVNN